MADLGAPPVKLDPLPRVDSEELFRSASERKDFTAEELGRLLDLAGELPLAITILAGLYDRRARWTMGNLIAHAQERSLDIAAEDKIAAGDQHQIAIRILAQRLQSGRLGWRIARPDRQVVEVHMWFNGIGVGHQEANHAAIIDLIVKIGQLRIVEIKGKRRVDRVHTQLVHILLELDQR